MDTTLLAHLALGSAALLTLIGMLRKDTILLQLNHFSNSRFNSHLQEKGELYTVPRLAAIAVLAGSITTMAKESWMVVIILAVVLAILGIYLLSKKRPDASHFNGRATGVYGISFILSTVAAPAAGFSMNQDTINSTYETAQAMLLCAVISPLLVILSNWLLGLFMKNEENGTKPSDNK
jgi:hypothetical protein